MMDRFKTKYYDTKTQQVISLRPIINTCENGVDIEFYGITISGEGQISQVELDKNNDRFKRMQCTGLKDKNGKLIYEGNIVNYSQKDILPYSHDILNAVIEFRKFQWCMVYFNNNMINAETRKPAEQKTWLGFDDFITSRIEVIGNIYENSDLLSEVKG